MDAWRYFCRRLKIDWPEDEDDEIREADKVLWSSVCLTGEVIAVSFVGDAAPCMDALNEDLLVEGGT